MSLKQNEDKVQVILAAWETLRPGKTFAGLTLAQFKDAVKPGTDARAEIAALENQLLVAQSNRAKASKAALAAALLVVNAVKGDPEEGEDGELYEAMGYVRRSERSSGLHRAKPAAPAGS